MLYVVYTKERTIENKLNVTLVGRSLQGHYSLEASRCV